MVEQFVVGLPGNAKNWILCHEPNRAKQSQIRLIETFELASNTAFPDGDSGSQRRGENKGYFFQAKESKTAAGSASIASRDADEENTATTRRELLEEIRFTHS